MMMLFLKAIRKRTKKNTSRTTKLNHHAESQKQHQQHQQQLPLTQSKNENFVQHVLHFFKTESHVIIEGRKSIHVWHQMETKEQLSNER